MGTDKLWSDVGGRPLLAWTLAGLTTFDAFDAFVVAAPPERWNAIAELVEQSGLPPARLLEGGTRRQDSVRLALECATDCEWVCVHDAARPLVTGELVRRALDAARDSGAATTGVPCVDTIKTVHDGHVVRTLDRSELIATQTPQAFSRALLQRAHAEALAAATIADDDALLVEQIGVRVAVAEGDPRNIKVTYPHDLDVVRAMVAG